MIWATAPLVIALITSYGFINFGYLLDSAKHREKHKIVIPASAARRESDNLIHRCQIPDKPESSSGQVGMTAVLRSTSKN